MHTQDIIVKIYDIPKIVVKFGEQGLGGTTSHQLLSDLEYDRAGHTGFQKQLNYIGEYKAYIVE